MKTKNIILCFIAFFAFCSCQDMFEPAEENKRELSDLPEESRYAHGLLMYGYDRLPYLTTTTTDIATDDAVTNNKNSNYLLMATGTWASDNNPMSQWDNCKDGIQYINLFLTIVDETKWAPSSSSKNQMFVDRLKGEAYGLRALFYYYLLMAHGGYAADGELYGVPLLTEPENGSSDFNQPRAKFKDCIDLIFADCDNAIKLLPAVYKDHGDLNEDGVLEKYKTGAILSNYNAVFGSKSSNLLSGNVAKAIKAQAALLAASPAFREKSGVTSEQAAMICASALEGIGGLAGFDKNGHIWYKNKTAIDNNTDIAEILWREDRRQNVDQEQENFPPTLYGNGRVNPSQNLVDAFPMRSGRPIKDNPEYKDQDPYANRDPRLAHYILYNGTTFRSTTICSGTYPYVVTQGGTTYSYYEDNINYGTTSTRTGYYLLKLLRDDVNPLQSNQQKRYHVYARIRYTELFLAYAEAANDAWGPKNDPKGIGYTAYDVIKAIRERAGLGTDAIGMPLPEGDAYLEECAADKAKMTDLIRNERRIELCFENKRFWDLRRWKMPLDETVRGMKVEKIDATKDPTPDNLKYTIIPDVEVRAYDNSYQCYGPIPRGEVLKWDALMQNKGWE